MESFGFCFLLMASQLRKVLQYLDDVIIPWLPTLRAGFVAHSFVGFPGGVVSKFMA